MTDETVLEVLGAAYPLWLFTREPDEWKASGPVVLVSSDLTGLLVLLAIADPAATRAWRQKEGDQWKTG